MSILPLIMHILCFYDFYHILSSSNYMTPPHHFVQPAVTLPLLTQTMEVGLQTYCLEFFKIYLYV